MPAKPTPAEIQAKLTTLLVEQLACDPATVIPSASFESLGADSLDFVEIIMAVEEEFAIDITDEEAEQIKTVQDAINFIGAAN